MNIKFFDAEVQMKKNPNQLTFWEHLEEFRGTLIRSLAAVVVCMIVAFCFKNFLFDSIILAPKESDFVTYRALCRLATSLNLPQLCPDDFSLSLININLSGQFIMHFTVAFWVGLIAAMPFVLYQLWKFVAPAFYADESKSIAKIFIFGSLLFIIGVGVSYFIVFPLTIRFLGSYEVSTAVANQITLQSYISTFCVLTLCMGIMFETPMVIALLSKLGLITKAILRKYRRWSIIIIMILAAIITPTSDPFTMMVVCLPLFLLYEIGIWICKN
ncbi:MAG TPA: twin-arginine translocase subunit TatC [Paludibacteraceae bacterium]|nr:twin-arginine translocase subunit TatC [Paludibacteraceae bacterium]